MRYVAVEWSNFGAIAIGSKASGAGGAKEIRGDRAPESETAPLVRLCSPAMACLALSASALIVIGAAGAAAAAASLPTDEHGDYNGIDLIEWIRSHPDGDVHESIRIGRERPGDPSSINGLFVRADGKPIEKGEMIAQVPWDHIISPGNKYRSYKFTSCKAIYNLAKELRLGEASSKAPYVQYLLTQSSGAMPGEFSKAGKKFLTKMLGGDDLPPYEETWKDDYERMWLGQCGGDEGDEVERFAYWLTSARDEDTLMVPIYDMANHSNDPKKLNTLSYKPKEAGDVFKFVASMRIEPGGQVYNSYNRCGSCADVENGECETFSFYKTPDLFVKFGFVEDYPQSWEFDRTDDQIVDEEFEFCLEKDDETGELVVEWEEDAMPDDEDIAWVKHHINRLGELEKDKARLEENLVAKSDGDADAKRMTRKEWDAIWTYHRALTTALNAALQSSDASRSDEL